MTQQPIARYAVLNRRRFLRLSTVGITSALVTAGVTACTGMAPLDPEAASADTSVAAPAPTVASAMPDLELKLTATATEVAILSGAKTRVLSYQAEVIAGDSAAVLTLPDSYLGPILRVRRGQRVRIHFVNDLEEPSIIHWHGLIVPPEMDGHPEHAIAPGERYTYTFEVSNRAGTYWYHPHPHGFTGGQVYHGLAGLFLVSDEEEQALPLPRAEQDIALVIQDRIFDADNQFIYPAQAAGTGMMAQMMGVLGDRILVNGRPDYMLSVATRVYRLRLLNGSNSRIYKLAWSDGRPMTVIGTDGGLLAQPHEAPYVTLAPGERVEVWADWRDVAVGSHIQLQSLAFTGVEASPMASMMQGTDPLPHGTAFDVMTFAVDRAENETLSLPMALASLTRFAVERAVNATEPRRFALYMDQTMQWTISGRVYTPGEIATDEQIPFATLELWEFANEMFDPTQDPAGRGGSQGGAMNHGAMGGMGQGGMMADFMAHPMHIHGAQFQVVERQLGKHRRRLH